MNKYWSFQLNFGITTIKFRNPINLYRGPSNTLGSGKVLPSSFSPSISISITTYLGGVVPNLLTPTWSSVRFPLSAASAFPSSCISLCLADHATVTAI